MQDIQVDACIAQTLKAHAKQEAREARRWQKHQEQLAAMDPILSLPATPLSKSMQQEEHKTPSPDLYEAPRGKSSLARFDPHMRHTSAASPQPSTSALQRSAAATLGSPTDGGPRSGAFSRNHTRGQSQRTATAPSAAGRRAGGAALASSPPLSATNTLRASASQRGVRTGFSSVMSAHAATDSLDSSAADAVPHLSASGLLGRQPLLATHGANGEHAPPSHSATHLTLGSTDSSQLLDAYRGTVSPVVPGRAALEQGAVPGTLTSDERRRLLQGSNKIKMQGSSVQPNPTQGIEPRMAKTASGTKRLAALPRKIDAIKTSDSVLKFRYGFSDAQISRMRRQQLDAQQRRRAYLNEKAEASAADVEARKEAFFRVQQATAVQREQEAERAFKANLKHLEAANSIAQEFEQAHIVPFERYEAERKRKVLADWEAKVYEPMQTAVNQHVTRKPLHDIVKTRAARHQAYLDVTNKRAVFTSIQDPEYNPEVQRSEHLVHVKAMHDPLKQQLTKRSREGGAQGGHGGGAEEFVVDNLRDEDTLIALRTRAMAGSTSKPSAIRAGRIALHFGQHDPDGNERRLQPQRAAATGPSAKQRAHAAGKAMASGDLADRIRAAHKNAPQDARWTLPPELWQTGVIDDTHYVKTYNTVGGGLYSTAHPDVRRLVQADSIAAHGSRNRVLPDWYENKNDPNAVAADVAAEEAVAFGKTYRDAQQTAAAKLASGQPVLREPSTVMASGGVNQVLCASVRPGVPHSDMAPSRAAILTANRLSPGVQQAMRAGERPGSPPAPPKMSLRGDQAHAAAALRQSRGVAEAVHVGSHPSATAGLTGFHRPMPQHRQATTTSSAETGQLLRLTSNVLDKNFKPHAQRPGRGSSELGGRIASHVSSAMNQVLHSSTRPGSPQAEFHFQRRIVADAGAKRGSSGALTAVRPADDDKFGGYNAPCAQLRAGTEFGLSLRIRPEATAQAGF